MTLEDRIDAAFAGAANGHPVDVGLLSDGYARVHTIEREILGLVRRCDSLLDEEGSSGELWRALGRRAAFREELTALRLRLETVRALAARYRQ